eukprot:4178512-Amphidinium_carterae.1
MPPVHCTLRATPERTAGHEAASLWFAAGMATSGRIDIHHESTVLSAIRFQWTVLAGSRKCQLDVYNSLVLPFLSINNSGWQPELLH